MSEPETRAIEWRVMTFHGNLHMATIPARDEEHVRQIVARTTIYRTVVQRRNVEPWEEVRDV